MHDEERRSPLEGVHTAEGARFTEFGGWRMPVEFAGIQEEHRAVRESVGLFDVSHMGQVTVTGPDAAQLTDRLVTNDVATLEPGEARYAAITDSAGIMHDDTVIYRLPETASESFLFVPNAGNDEWAVDRWRSHRDDWHMDASVRNATNEYAMLALQGPAAIDLVSDGIDERITDIGRFEMIDTRIAETSTFVSRTGYTGEDGLEFLIPWNAAEEVWSTLDAPPCGLGARDTLRLEAGFLLSGQDFDPTENPRTPYEARIGFAVKLNREFVGRDVLERQDEEGVEQRLVGLRLVDRGVPRHGYDIRSTDGESIGAVTSGTMSPTLDVGIGLGYVSTAYADPETRIRVVIRGTEKKARIESLPFVE